MSSFINSILSHEGVNATVALARRKSSSVTNTVSNVFSNDKKDKENLANHAPQVNGGGGAPTGSPQHQASPPSPVHRRPLRLKNVATHAEAFDTLHLKSFQAPLCEQHKACVGSIMFPPNNKPNIGGSGSTGSGSCPALSGTGAQTGGGAQTRSREEIFLYAKDFLEQYFTSIRRLNSPAHQARWEQVQKEVNAAGTYQLTETELVYGAKTAWRNSARCIGRIQWSKLQVFDCRSVSTTSGMFEALCNHIKYGTNKGNIRSAITIFPQRTDGKHDFRVWNPQLIAYAGYKNPDGSVVGDPLNVEFTEVCIRLGWKSKRTRFDILPLVLSANGHDPDYFDLPPDLVMEVPLSHPKYEWFEDLGLRWFALPAVSGMLFDVGGLEFPAAPFNGWYMGTEIGCRNLCDAKRYNMLETIATKMGLDTRTPVTLWKDRAVVEVNVAVLHSFQSRNVTIVDHHTAADSFMKHYENENRLRSGCPADWVWIVPPLSSSVTPVFHQEMALYSLKPSYEYQEAAWRSHIWKKGRDHVGKNVKKPRRKFHFKQIARAVKFTSKLFGRALSRRIKATVLYATETGKSEAYAKKLTDIFGHAFNAQVYCMDEYDMSSIEHEALLLVVTSTFGNGDPPENGQAFAQSLYTMKISETAMSNGSDHNIRFAVFALGSSAYPNFCAFGQYVDNLLGELGGERLLKMECGDEMCGQEQAFRKWATDVFSVACETFCLDDDDSFLEATMAFKSESISPSSVRFVDAEVQELDEALSRCHNKRVRACTLLRRSNLHGSNASRATLQLELEAVGLEYQPGDHVGVFAINRPDLVDGVLAHLQQPVEPDKVVELQLEKEAHTSNGVVKTWEPHPRLPRVSVRTLLSRFLDITTPPSPHLLQWLATQAKDAAEQRALTLLATESAAYEDWRHWRFPHLLEVLEEFPSVRPPAALLCAQLTPLQPRFYSISSSPQVHQGQVHLTVAVVTYRTQDGEGPEHFGVCSTYLQHAEVKDRVYLFVRSAPNFHLPTDISRPIIMVGPGTGVAPFRGFWHHRRAQLENTERAEHVVGPMWLFFGCRQRALDLYKDEKATMLKDGVLDQVFLALSREPSIPKTYVQDLVKSEAAAVYRKLVLEGGHFYVCGDCTMAEHVYQTLKAIIQERGAMSDNQVERYMLKLRDENRYHEDIFGITLRTAEVHNRSRESARSRMASQSQ